MFRLIKASLPNDWEKVFATKADACAELRKHICRECLAGEHNYVGCETEYTTPPNPDDIDALLGTSCGWEFWLEEEQATH